MQKSIELQLYSQIQAQETLVLLVFLKIGKQETQQVIMLMLLHKNVNNFSKCLHTLTSNSLILFQLTSQLVEQIFLLQDLVWEDMVL